MAKTVNLNWNKESSKQGTTLTDIPIKIHGNMDSLERKRIITVFRNCNIM